MRALAAVGLALFVARTLAAAEPAPVFEVAVGGNGPIAGEDENLALFPVGGAPASFAVDADGRWWLLDAIGARVLVIERDGTVARTIPFPAAGKEKGKEKRPTFRSDLELDGAGGLYVVDATAHRIERWSKDGVRTWSVGSEKLPRGQGGLDLPQRVERIGENLFVTDRGSERLLRFTADGDYTSAVPGARAAPIAGGGYAILTGDIEATWLETTAAKGAHGKPVTKLAAAEGRTLHDVSLVGTTAAGDVVLALSEGSADAPDRVRIRLFDRAGAPRGELTLPYADDDATPIRRWRLTPSGSLAWFRVKNGRFQAFETVLPVPATSP